jgi:hypothetical protein
VFIINVCHSCVIIFILKVKLGSLLNEEKKGVNDGSSSNSIDDADNLNGSDDGSVNGEVFSGCNWRESFIFG